MVPGSKLYARAGFSCEPAEDGRARLCLRHVRKSRSLLCARYILQLVGGLSYKQSGIAETVVNGRRLLKPKGENDLGFDPGVTVASGTDVAFPLSDLINTQEGGARRSEFAAGRFPDGPAVSPDRVGEPGLLPEVFPNLLTHSGPGARALRTTRPDFPRQQPTPKANPASPFGHPLPPAGGPLFLPRTRRGREKG